MEGAFFSLLDIGPSNKFVCLLEWANLGQPPRTLHHTPNFIIIIIVPPREREKLPRESEKRSIKKMPKVQEPRIFVESQCAPNILKKKLIMAIF